MVTHLTFEELLEFNSMNLSEAGTSELTACVITHVRTCADCRKALAAIQSTAQELSSCIKGSRRIADARVKGTIGEKKRLF